MHPSPSGSSPPIVAWEQGSPAHQALKAAPAISSVNPSLSVKLSCTCLRSILPRPPQQSYPAAKLLGAVAGLVFSFITRVPSGGTTWGPRPTVRPESGPLAFKEARPGGFPGVLNVSWPSGKCSFLTLPRGAHFQVSGSSGLQVPGHYWRERPLATDGLGQCPLERGSYPGTLEPVSRLPHPYSSNSSLPHSPLR